MVPMEVLLKNACLLELAPSCAADRLLRLRDLLIASPRLMEAFDRLVAPFGLRLEQYRASR